MQQTKSSSASLSSVDSRDRLWLSKREGGGAVCTVCILVPKSCLDLASDNRLNPNSPSHHPVIIHLSRGAMECHVLAAARQSLLKQHTCLSLSRASAISSTRPTGRFYSASPSPFRPATHSPTDSQDAKTNTGTAGSSQAYPLSGYYFDILSARSLHSGQATTSPSASQPQTPTPPPAAPLESLSPQEKMAIVFGTRLAGPGRSSRYGPGSEPAGRTINGVVVPPRPEEPDNCCMSGCVHCVWDDYRDEMEEWAGLLAQAKARGPSKTTATIPATGSGASSTSISVDDDGGGSETNWTLPNPDEDLFADIPVGIREFMKIEKKLKQLHQQEGSQA